MKRANLVKMGLHTSAIAAVVGSIETGITAVAAGTISTSYPLTADHSVVATAAAGSGCRLLDDLEIGDSVDVTNLGANAVNVFPGNALYTINGAGAGAALAVAVGKTATIKRVGAIAFVAQAGA